MDTDPIAVQRHLQGVDYPAERDELVAHAEENGAPAEVLEALEGLEDTTFDDPTEVMRELGSDD